MKTVMRAGFTGSCEILSGGCVCLFRGSSVTLQESRLPGGDFLRPEQQAQEEPAAAMRPVRETISL